MKASRETTQSPKSTTEIDYEKIVAAINRTSDTAKAMRTAGLTSEAISVLIKHRTGLPLATIKTVLVAAEELKRWCLSRES